MQKAPSWAHATASAFVFLVALHLVRFAFALEVAFALAVLVVLALGVKFGCEHWWLLRHWEGCVGIGIGVVW